MDGEYYEADLASALDANDEKWQDRLATLEADLRRAVTDRAKLLEVCKEAKFACDGVSASHRTIAAWLGSAIAQVEGK